MSITELLTGCLSWNGIDYNQYQDFCKKLFDTMEQHSFDKVSDRDYQYYVVVHYTANMNPVYHLMRVTQVDSYPDE